MSSKTLKQMPITTAFIYETLRLANVTEWSFTRKIKTDIQLPNGQIMPKGTEWAVDYQRISQVGASGNSKI